MEAMFFLAPHDTNPGVLAKGLVRPSLLIHESFRFVNKHPQQIEDPCCGFRQGDLHPLKASPERRPVGAAVEVLRQAQDPERSRRARRADCSWSQQGFMNNPG